LEIMPTTIKKFAPKKLTISFVLFCFLLTQVVSGIFLYARPARAQLVVSDPITGAQTTVKNIKDFLKIVVVNGGIMAMINAASNFTQKIAYDLAVSLASGGGGEMPLFSTKGWGDYLADAGKSAAGEFIGSFGDMFGVDLCAPPNPRLGLSLQLNLANTFGGAPPAPKCEWSQIASNWESFISEVQTEDFLRQMASQFQVGYGTGSNDMDLALTGFIGAFNVERSASEEAGLTREEGQGFLPLTELISGKTKTPAEVIRQTSEITTKGPVEAENVKTGLSGQALSAGAEGILMQFVSTFVNTLLSKTMQKIFTKGMYSLGDLFPSSGSGVGEEEGTAWGGRKAAELAFADFLTPQIKEGGAVDILTQFVVCPEKFRGANNCVMDGQFEAAVRRAQTGEPLTVQQAIKQNLLHADWPLIPPTDEASNQDPYCYSKAYCYSNLAKLRKARIIPIGWEIAALSSTSDRPVGLGEVVSKFYDCNADGKADTEHPYCHLIDPNWILKAPPEQCRAKVYGPVLQTAENSFRQEVCVDAPTCIAEDDQGNCEGGWANCLREKNIWRLNGDKCDAQYDTCRVLKRRDGQQMSYLINTIDNGPPCTSEDVGCRWYSTEQSKVGDAWQWQDRLTGAGVSSRRNARIFFNKNISQCDEPGCNEFLRTTKGSKLNLIANGSFEEFVGTADDAAKDEFVSWPIPWGRYGDPTAQAVVSDTYFGRTAIKAAGVIGQTVRLEEERGGRTFTLSLFAKGCSATSTFDFGGEVTARNTPASSGTSWQRYQATRSFPSGDSATTIDIAFYNASISPTVPCLIDAVQLEEGSMTNYHEGWGKTGEALYLKSAPDYYACYDYNSDGSIKKTNDADECKNFAKACEEKDVGCEKFTPANGDPWIPGVASYPDDYCPQECVGYQTFKQVGTDFEQEKFPVYFIPSTARICSAAEAGCDQFTSLESEAVANFSSIRRCEKPGVATSATFYTWEGSDTSGYQLKNWNLKISKLNEIIIDRSPTGGVGPCTRLDPADSTQCADDRSIGTCTKADLATNPDCREFYDKDGNKHYRLYSKTIIATDDCHPYRKTVSNLTDCGISGGKWDGTKSECTYQVYLPETRVCSAAAVGCRAYRGNSGANVSIILSDNFDDSSVSGWGGTSAPTISSESLTVGGKSLSVAREATASKDVGSSVRKGGIYTLSFWAKGDSKLDIKFSGVPNRPGTTEPDTTKYFSVNDTNPATPTAELSFDWRYFSLGPIYITWVPDTNEKLQITPRGGTMAAYLDNIVLREVQDYIYLVKNSWNTPASCDRTFFIDSTAINSADCSARGGAWNAQTSECIVSGALPQAQLGCALYRDRASRDHYLKSFSRLCSPDAAGCEKLIKTQNNTTTVVEEFNKENDGDPALPLEGQLSELSAEERLSDNVRIPADELAFLIVDDTYKCKAENKSCTAFGAPKLDATGNVKVGDDGKPQYDAVSLLADPAKFSGDKGKILCQVQYQGCEEYSTTEGGALYFKDPGVRTCEWKENITVSGRSVSGWFRKGTEPAEPCDPLAFYGGTYNIWKNGDIRCTLPAVCQDKPGDGKDDNNNDGTGGDGDGDGQCACTVGAYPIGFPAFVSFGIKSTGIAGSSCTVAYGKRTCPYSGWVGECPATANMCTKFVDPSDTKTSDEGEPYYYIKNNKLTSGNCNGMASQRDGCVLLNDTSITQLNYSANATYFSSENKSGDPGGTVAPIDCVKNPSSPFCGRCSKVVHFVGYDEYRFGDYCRQDSDCPADFLTDTPVSEGEGCVTITNSAGVNFTYSPGHGDSAHIRALLTVFPPNKVVFEPVLAGKVNDSNTLLKVRRDRVCGEWLDCTSTNSTFDSQTGRQKTLCEELGVCNSYNKAGEATKCTDWVDEPDTYRKVLTKDLYTSRDTSWSGMEYTGDSIYNQYQAADLRGINIGTESNPKNVLGFIDDRCFNDVSPISAPVACGLNPGGYCASNVNGLRCGDWGKCYNHLCVTNFRGDPTSPDRLLFVDNNPETASCRAYPEQSSPFPTTVVSKWGPTLDGTDLISKKPGFTGANVCERQFAKICVGGPKEGDFCTSSVDCRAPGGTVGECENQELPNACECNYKKVSYSGGAVIKYFSAKTGEDSSLGDIPSICVGGSTPGKRCAADVDCNTLGGVGGQCVSRQREDEVLGWSGYCLERDTANSINGDPENFACLTWYPIDQLPGMPDMYNQYTEAGFSMTNVNYCLKPSVYYNKQKHPSSYYCATLGPGVPDICGNDDWYYETRNECLQPAINNGNMRCTKDEWIIFGHCGSSHNPDLCDATSYDNDCPYHCVPKHSVHTDPAVGTGECQLNEIIGALASSFQSGDSDYERNDGTRYLGRYKGYDYVFFEYGTDPAGTVGARSHYSSGLLADCKAEGVPASIRVGSTDVSTASRGVVGSYFACEESVKVSGSEANDNKAWTNNLWSGRSGSYAINVDAPTLENYLRYVYSSVISPFGRGIGNIGEPGTDIYSIPTCQKSDTKEMRLKTVALGCDSGFAPLSETDPAFSVPNESRSYAGISTAPYSPGRSCTTGATCNSDRYCRSVICSRACTSDSDCAVGSENYGPCDTATHLCAGGVSYDTGDPAARIESALPSLCPFGFGAPLRGSCGTAEKVDGGTCAASTECQDWVCDSGTRRCRAPGDVISIGAGTATIEDDWFNKAKARISQLFAKSINFFNWDWLPGGLDAPKYNLDSSSSVSVFDYSSKEGGTGPGGQSWPVVPQIFALGTCTGEKCRQGISGSVTVNGIDGNGLSPTGFDEPSNAVGYGGRLKATMQFFGQADENAMPIRSVATDWGDDSDKTPRGGRYKNHLGLKENNDSQCDNSTFGRTADACTDQYFMFTHTYSCPKDGAGMAPCGTAPGGVNCYTASCPEDINGAADGNGSCCVYKPKVQIKDNWGWCNGSCSGTSGCYADGPSDNCSVARSWPPGQGPWTSFQGQVIVVPK